MAAGTPWTPSVRPLRDAAFLDSLHLWKTPQVDCGDERGEVCIDYSEWTQAWTEIGG
jgi:putative spermidine/putrescine transport system substrate-binding protein